MRAFQHKTSIMVFIVPFLLNGVRWFLANKVTPKYRLAALMLLLVSVGVFIPGHSSLAHTLPIVQVDARSTAMGGVGIAQSVRNASFYNPALVAIEPDEFEWYVLPYSEGDFDTGKKDVKNAVLDSTFQDFEYSSSMIAIPSATLGGAMYISDYELHTIKVIDDSGTTKYEHRSLDVFELGFTVGKLMNLDWLSIENVMVGVNTKILLLKSYGYNEDVATGGLNVDRDQAERNSEINFDLGFSKEYGVWKTGIIIKNLLTQENNFGDSSDKYELTPQVRAGVAYQSRRAIVEFDIDLIEAEGLGFASDTQYTAIGWEWRTFPGFYLRMGYNQNLAGDTQSTFSSGIGINAWGFLMDFTIYNNDDGDGGAVEFGFEF